MTVEEIEVKVKVKLLAWLRPASFSNTDVDSARHDARVV